MPILAGYKLKVAARLNSGALRADAIEADCVRLFVNRPDGRTAATRILVLVVARQRGCAGPDSVLDQGKLAPQFKRKTRAAK